MCRPLSACIYHDIRTRFPYSHLHFILVPVKNSVEPNRLLAQHLCLSVFFALHLQSFSHAESNFIQNEPNIADTFVALKLGRCLRANRFHCDLIVTSFGNRCIEMPSVYVVFLQLTKPGPPATQNFPLLRFFLLVVIMAGRFYTP